MNILRAGRNYNVQCQVLILKFSMHSPQKVIYLPIFHPKGLGDLGQDGNLTN